MKNPRYGFTMVEMLAVISVIAVLMTIVFSVASNSIKSARKKRAQVMCSSLQQAISAYYAQEGRWPSQIEDADTEDKDTIKFEGDKADKIFQEIVGKGLGLSGRTSVLVDASALFVCGSEQAGNKKARGRPFSEVVAGKNAIKSISQLAFGYQDSGSGYFRRFRVVYNCRTDTATVEM